MAQTLAENQCEEKCASIDSKIHFQLHPPEVLKPQVLVKEPALEKGESRSIKKKLMKMFSKVNLNVKITEEVKYINDVKARNDTKMMGYRTGLMNI